MKNFIITLVFICSISFGYTQGTNGFVKYGVRAGLNVSNIDFEPSPAINNAHRSGFFFGGFVEYPLSDKISLTPELQWSAEGGKDESIRADYINLPIQLRFALGERFIFGAGPQFSLKTWKNSDNFDTWAFSGVGGLEYMITDEIFIDARAVYGFSNILDDASAPLEATQFIGAFRK